MAILTVLMALPLEQFHDYFKCPHWLHLANHPLPIFSNYGNAIRRSHATILEVDLNSANDDNQEGEVCD